MSKSLREQIAQQLAALSSAPVVEDIVIAPVVQPSVQVQLVPQEPIVKTGESLVVPETKSQDKTQLFNWCKTRLNVVLVNNYGTTEDEFLTLGDKTLYMNKPFSSFKVKGVDKASSTKHLGYLQTMFLPFANTLSTITKPQAVAQLGTEKEAMEMYRDLGISIMENVSKLLPCGESNRFNIYCNVATEKNSLINDIILEFYLVYQTDYHGTDMLDRLQKMESAIKKANVLAPHFGITVSNLFSLESQNYPHDFVPWYTEGYSNENYTTTNYLPVSREDRLTILGVLPNSKREMPHIILSKTL
jgi:hypothetical protein